MNLVQATKAYFIKCSDFKTRSSRSEFWWANLFLIILIYAIGIFNNFLFLFFYRFSVFSTVTAINIASLTSTILMLFLFVASTALAVRRLHDLNKSGWWLLIGLTIIGLIPLIIWLASVGENKKNRFGDCSSFCWSQRKYEPIL